jgi:hypothetical protein
MAYALIKEPYCTKTMRDRVEAHPDFDSKIKDNPVELLKAIRVLVHDTVRAQYPYVSLVDSVAWLMTIKQYDDSLLDYAKRFKQARDVMKTYIGNGLLDAFVERSEEYIAEQDVDKKKELKKDAWNRLMAYLFLKGADSSKYGSLTRKFITDFSGGDDTYPKTLQKAVDILTNHRFDDTWSEKKKAAAAREKEKQRADSEQATSIAQKEREKRQKDYICHCCGKKGHISPNCPKKDEIKKKDWHISKAINAMQEAHDDDDDANETDDSEAEEVETTSRRSEGPRAELEAGLSRELVMLMNLMMKPVVGKHFKRVNDVPFRKADWCQKRIYS